MFVTKITCRPVSRIRISKNGRGFTLTELAIVLGVMGIILGAIWAAAAAVYANNRLKTAVTEIAYVVEGYRSLYSARGVDTADWTDVTCNGVTDGFFPSSMLLPGVTCTANNAATYPQHPWGSYVAVASMQSWGGAINISLWNLTPSACAQYASQLASVPDIVWEDINGTAIAFPPVGNNTPWTTVQISGLCNASASANYIYTAFKAR